MRFEDIYEPVLALWPERIPLNDAGPVSSCEYGHADCPPGQHFPALSEVWNRVEREAGHDDPWRDLMVWTLFQTFHAESMRLVAGGVRELSTRAVRPETVERRYFQNLQGEDWESLLPEYERV